MAGHDQSIIIQASDSGPLGPLVGLDLGLCSHEVQRNEITIHFKPSMIPDR